MKMQRPCCFQGIIAQTPDVLQVKRLAWVKLFICLLVKPSTA